ncbi:MAG: FtsX-like permease family protein [Chitinophagaceae bacterium]
MLKNYLKIAWRNLRKNKVFSIINILGLSLGIACALLIIFHIKEELSYDKGFTKADRIFRVTLEGIGKDTRHWAATSPVMGVALQQYLPEIEKIVRFHRLFPYQVFSYTPSDNQTKRFEEKGGLFADSTATDVFDLQFTAGDETTALSQMNAIVLTEEMAKKYFGKENPVGKTLQDDVKKIPLKVTGVIKSFPFRTHLKFDYLVSMTTITKYLDQRSLENRGWSGFYNYVLLKKEQSETTIAKKSPAFLVKFFEAAGEKREDILANRKLMLQPVTSIHLHSKLEKELSPNSDITYIYIFSIAALFILLIAAVNFINISAAQAFNRMKEIGLRKVAGGTKMQLVRQFLGESLLITLIAAIIAVILFKSIIPFYNNLTSKDIQFQNTLTLTNFFIILSLVAIIGLLAGFYPAWFVAGFNPIDSLKGKKNTASSVNTVRKGLIVFQFVISVFMIFSTVIIYRQMKLFHNQYLGFNKEQLVAVTMYNDMWSKFGFLSDNIKKNKAIASHSIISTLPGERFGMYGFGQLSVAENENIPGSARALWGDDKLLTTLQIPLKAGRNFFPQFPDIKNHEFILNEAAVKAFQLKDPLGKRVVLDNDTGDIVGLIKDFNFASLHASIEPLVIEYNPYKTNYLLLKVQPNQVPQTLQFMESNIKQLFPSSTFTYSFIDEKLNQLYASENRMSTVFKAFAAFAIFISCLGLFGLSAYSAQLRIKEVGIRKVLGASIYNVTLLLTEDFIKLVLLATVISWPLAWWMMSRWLEGFAYRVNITIWTFLISGCFALLVALITVSYQAIKAAILNPVKSLKAD